jgi:hypothetical protein
MTSDAAARAAFRVEKRRMPAILTLSNGELVRGCFFLGSSATRQGQERVDELLNIQPGFFPFERDEDGATHVVLYNRNHVVLVELSENQARAVPGYEVATKHRVVVILSNHQRIGGTVPVHLPKGHDRLSDWARDPIAFRYVETDSSTLLVNVQHITGIIEVDAQ